MRKLFFLSAANSIHTVKWVNALSKYYEVHLVFCPNHSPDVNKISSKVILHKLKYNAKKGYYINALQVKKIYRNINPDIINVHYASGYGTLARIARLPNVLLNVWGSDVYDFPNSSKFKERILVKNVLWAKYLASTSNVMANELKKHIPDLRNKIFITPFGVDLEKFKNYNAKKVGKLIKIGNIKSLEKIYGIDLLILSFKKLIDLLSNKGKKKISDNLRLLIYGDGSEKLNLDNLIINNHLENKVLLMEKISNDEVPKVLNELDIFCATSLKESFGVSLVEAMACEKPIVASNVDGFREVVDDGVTGIIVKKNEITEIASALEELVLNSKLREQMGIMGRKRAQEYFDWNKNVLQMLNIYDSMLKRG